MPTKVKGTTGVDKVEAGAVITNPAFSGDATVSGSLTVGGVNVFSGPYRNLIINGDMQIAQRGTSTASITTAAYYTVDRFKTSISGLGTWTQSQSTDVPTGQGFANSLKMDCTTADASPASGDYLSIYHSIEGQNLQHLKYGTSSAESFTISFWVKSNKTGTYNVMCLQMDNSLEMFSQSYTIDTANTWEKKTITYTGDIDGVINNDNGEGLRVYFYLAAGTDRTSGSSNTTWSTYTAANEAPSQVNLADSTSNYINITGVQLEVGEGASDFEFLPYDVQLQRCQRYYQFVSFFGVAANTGEMGVTGPFRTEMRASPALSVYSTSGTGVYTAEFTTHTLTKIGQGQVTVGNLTTFFLGPRGLYNIYCTGLATGGIYVGTTYVSAEL